MTTDQRVSFRPSDFVEGGAVPVDKNLLWKENRFCIFEYKNKAGEVVATTLACRVTYVDDDGGEYVQHYSAGDKERFQPSEDGKSLVAVVAGTKLSKSSNFYILMNALVNAGFPENKVTGDVSILDGLYTYNIGMPEPKRTGLVREAPAEGARERVISVPSKVLRLPWEKAPAGKGAAKSATAVASGASAGVESGTEGVKALELVAAALSKAESVTRRELSVTAIRAKVPTVGKYVFSEDFQADLLAGGYTLDGETITKAG